MNSKTTATASKAHRAAAPSMVTGAHPTAWVFGSTLEARRHRFEVAGFMIRARGFQRVFDFLLFACLFDYPSGCSDSSQLGAGGWGIAAWKAK